MECPDCDADILVDLLDEDSSITAVECPDCGAAFNLAEHLAGDSVE